ncbi:MAG: hypothetical protein ABIN58_05815 [candidate division WOR-3 bacterium]
MIEVVVKGVHHSFGAVPKVEFFQQPPQVGADGALADEEALRDLNVREPFPEELKHLHLPLADGWLVGIFSKAGHQPCGEGWREHDLSFSYSPYGLNDLDDAAILGEVSIGAEAKRLEQVFLPLRDGEDDDLHIAEALFDADGGFHAIASGHKEVHDDHVRAEFCRFLDGVLSIDGFADYGNIRLGFKNARQVAINAAAAGKPLSADDVAFIREVLR